jgi:hypothetical protein
MTYWIIIHTHKHGVSTWVEWGVEYPDEEDLKGKCDFEEPEEGVTDLHPEMLDIEGPFQVPANIIAQIKAA